MSKAVIIQHVDHETPGRLLPALRENGIPVDIRRVHRGDEVPSDCGEIGLLIVLGGPMGVADIAQHSYLQREVDLIQKFIATDRPMLGICLGAQLLAHAANAKVSRNVRPGKTPEEPGVELPEFGFKPVSFPFPGGTEPIVYGMHDGAMMFHWHRDTFELPKLPPPANAPTGPVVPAAAPTGSILLSSTRECRNQAFRFKNRLFGFQYHFEMTPDGIEAMLQNAKADLDSMPGAAEQIRSDTGRLYPQYQRLGDRLIGNLLGFLRLA